MSFRAIPRRLVPLVVAGSIAATVPGFRLVLGRGAYGGVELARRLAELARHA